MCIGIGDRIRALREFRDITQDELARRSGVSVDTIRKLEQGVRESARINTLRNLARALDVQLERLVGQTTVTQQLTGHGGLLALRDAIQDPGTLPGVLGDANLEDPPGPDEWAQQVQAATAAYWAGGYSALGQADTPRSLPHCPPSFATAGRRRASTTRKACGRTWPSPTSWRRP
ncbi:helix-turn-helix domain-containing protein [Streptomyces californicus]|uniref:helix-turn-helix domain-containing protein n=1 Tax=Streptomyces californicus TaxID=67351 RepID=UPI00367A69B1